jgi:hypothetical protein
MLFKFILFLKISVKLESALAAEIHLAEGERLEEQPNIEKFACSEQEQKC